MEFMRDNREAEWRDAVPENAEEAGREREQAAGPGAGEQPAPPEAAEPPDVQALAAERDRLAEQHAALYDRLLRKQADFENFRKRMDRERHEFHQAAVMEVVRDLLPVLDGLERALATDSAHAGEEFHAGVELIARQLFDMLARCGLQAVEARGKKFDPHLHQAVEMVETAEHEDQTVLEEWQRGYKFKGRLLRPAMVKVAVRRESP